MAKPSDENFYIVQGWMMNRLKLKGVALSVFAIIYGFSQDGENEYTGSLQYLCDFTGGTSKPTIIKALKELVEKKYILRREEFINGVQFNRYKINIQLLNSFNGGSKETLTGVVNSFNGGSKETLTNKEDNNISYIEDIKYIVDFLNQKAGTAYRHTTAATQKHIKARLAEGFTVNEFMTVIEKKCAQWKGGEMEKYLRPETLFGAKFESYLNEAAATGAKPQPPQNDNVMKGIKTI